MLSSIKTTIVGLIVYTQVNDSLPNNELPLWSWKCEEDKCVPKKVTDDKTLMSLITCNMLCSYAQLWPLPAGNVNMSYTALPVRSDYIKIEIISSPSDIVKVYVQNAFSLFIKNLKKIEKAVVDTEIHYMLVRVTVKNNPDPRMRLNTNESYKLIIKKTKQKNYLEVNITSDSFCGIRHGLETLNQLIWYDPYYKTLYVMDSVYIDDTPKFHYRGIMVDTANNYFTINELIQLIDAMSASKLNTFHWHMQLNADLKLFPLMLKSLPGQTRLVYTVNDIKTLVQRAGFRGIRILLEVDTSVTNVTNSSSEINKVFKNLNKDDYSDLFFNQRDEHLDLLDNKKFIKLYSEMTQLTGVDDIFHIGNHVKYWNENHLNTSFLNFFLEFTKNTSENFKNSHKYPRIILMWAPPLHNILQTELKKNIGIQALNPNIEQYGVRTVISHQDAWNFDDGTNAWNVINTDAIYNSWQRVYNYRPWIPLNNKAIIGGEATVWTHKLGDGCLSYRIWPRGAALAERLWADLPEGSTRSIHARLDVHRFRLIQRDIDVAPLWSMWCTHNPFTCN